MTRWVTETILAQEDLKKRVAIIKHLVSIAEVGPYHLMHQSQAGREC